MRVKSISSLLACVVFTAAPLMAQTGPALLVKAFGDHHSFELHGEAAIFSNGKDKDSDAGFDLSMYDAAGLWRVTGEDQRHVRIGFAATYMDIDSPMLPERLVDQSIAVGFNVGEAAGWNLEAALGVGHAGNTPYTNAQSLYGMFDLVASKKLDENASLRLFLNYNGNRTFLPDIPLPGIAYHRRSSDQLSYTVGLPYSIIQWKPMERLSLDFEYAVPSTINVLVDYELIENWHVFAAFRNRLHAFAIDGDQDNRRVFFEQRRVEAGVRWAPCLAFEIEIAGGYAFSQEFTRGYDVRDTDSVLEVTDEPYVKIAGKIRF